MARLWLSIKKTTLVITLFAAAFAAPSGAEEYRAWTGDFMRMGAGARAMGMGNAYTAVEGDIYSSYFNPAGLSSIKGRQFTFSFRHLTMDRAFRYFALGGPVGLDAGFALTWLNAGTDDIVGRDLNGNPTGNLEDSRNAFTLSFGKEINKLLSVGLNAKYTMWKLADDDAKSFGFDFGLSLRPIRNLTASFVVRDINSRYTWQSDRWAEYISDADGQTMEKEDEFPAYYTFGLSYKMFDEKLILSTTLESIEDYPLGVDVGASYEYNRSFILRTGFYNYNSSDELDYGSFTAGFTVNVTRSIGFDYAYMTDGFDDGSIHIISLVMGYGELD